MTLSPWFQYEIGKIRMEQALAERERDRLASKVLREQGVRPRLGAFLGIAGLALLIRETLRTLFTARREVAGL